MAEDRITSDMKSMASSYDTPRAVSLLQDKARDASSYVKDKVGKITNARDAIKDKAASTGRSTVKGATSASESIQQGFSGLKDRNSARHKEVLGSMKDQLGQLKGISNSVSGVYNMLFKERYGPDVEPYSRDEEGVGGLAEQLRRQHAEIMDELERIRKAVVMGGSGGGGGLFGAFGGGGGRRSRTSRTGGGTNSSSNRSGSNGNRSGSRSRIGRAVDGIRSKLGMGGSSRTPPNPGPSPTSNQSRSSASWSRANSGASGTPPPPRVGGASGWAARLQNLGNSKFGRILSTAVTVGAAGYTGAQMLFGDDGAPELPSSNTPSSSPGASPAAQSTGSSYSGLGSVSASEESRQGVYTISTGVGDNGGVSYGTHQLATENGSMARFLQSQEGQPFAPAFEGLQPGTNAFNARYLEVARANEEAFAKAQKDYIFRTHYAPMLNNVKRGSGFDATNRGPAVHEMLYSTGVQYGAGTSVINNALRGYDPNSMSDADIIRRVQEYKSETVGTYFRSSAPDIQRSVYNRTFRERDKLLALDAEYQQQVAAGNAGQPQGSAQVASSSPSSGASSPPLMNEEAPVSLALTEQPDQEQSAEISRPDNADLAAVGATAALGAGGALALMPARNNSSPASAPPPASSSASAPVAPAPASSTSASRNVTRTTGTNTITSATPATPRSVTATPPRPPSSIAAPSSTSSGAGGSVAPATSRSVAGKVVQGAKRVPVLSLGFAAIDTARVMNDDSLDGGEKAGAVTDIAGSTVGGIAGAKVGASTGAALGLLAGPLAPLAVPVGGAVGGLAGGIAGYMAGGTITNTARNFVGGFFGNDEEAEEIAGEINNARDVAEQEAEVESETPVTGTESAASSDLPENHPMMTGQRNVQTEAENSPSSLADAQSGEPVSVGNTSSASEVVQSLEQGRSSGIISPEALSAATTVGGVASNTQARTVVNNFPLQGQSSSASSAPTSGPQVSAQSSAQSSPSSSSDNVPSSQEQERPSSTAMMAFRAITGAMGVDAEKLLSASTRREAPEHMRKNLHGYEELSAGPAIVSRTQNMQSPDVYTAPTNRQEEETEGRSPPQVQEEPTRPTTVREGNRVSHDFTQQVATERSPSVPEITNEDLTTRPVQSTGAPTFRPEDQINIGVNDAHARMDVSRLTARQASSTIPAAVPRGQTGPAEGTAPDFMASPGYAASSAVTSVSGQNQSSASTPTSDVSTQTVSDVPAQRRQYDSVQKVMMMEPASQTREKPAESSSAGRTPSTGTFESRNHQPTIDDTPALVSDFGLTLLNTGFI